MISCETQLRQDKFIQTMSLKMASIDSSVMVPTPQACTAPSLYPILAPILWSTSWEYSEK